MKKLTTNLSYMHEFATWNLIVDSDLEDEIMKTISPEHPNVELKVSVNGIEIDAKTFTNSCDKFLERVESYYTEHYADIDALIEQKAKELLEVESEKALKKLQVLNSALESVEDLIKPKWLRGE